VVAPTITLIVASLALVISSSAAARVIPAAAAACATNAQASQQLGGTDLAFLKRFLPCEVARLRPVSGGRLRFSATLSRDAASFLTADTRLSIAASHATLEKQIHTTGTTYCGKDTDFRVGDATGDSSPPPVLTPTSITRELKQALAGEKLLDAPGTVFGFAVARHVVFHDPDRTNPVSFAVLIVHCL
jgi:hypothetical protein